jgi:hypothetical protein
VLQTIQGGCRGSHHHPQRVLGWHPVGNLDEGKKPGLLLVGTTHG